jgi:hypothetical protein
MAKTIKRLLAVTSNNAGKLVALPALAWAVVSTHAWMRTSAARNAPTPLVRRT